MTVIFQRKAVLRSKNKPEKESNWRGIHLSFLALVIWSLMQQWLYSLDMLFFCKSCLLTVDFPGRFWVYLDLNEKRKVLMEKMKSSKSLWRLRMWDVTLNSQDVMGVLDFWLAEKHTSLCADQRLWCSSAGSHRLKPPLGLSNISCSMVGSRVFLETSSFTWRCDKYLPGVASALTSGKAATESRCIRR